MPLHFSFAQQCANSRNSGAALARTRAWWCGYVPGCMHRYIRAAILYVYIVQSVCGPIWWFCAPSALTHIAARDETQWCAQSKRARVCAHRKCVWVFQYVSISYSVLYMSCLSVSCYKHTTHKRTPTSQRATSVRKFSIAEHRVAFVAHEWWANNEQRHSLPRLTYLLCPVRTEDLCVVAVVCLSFLQTTFRHSPNMNAICSDGDGERLMNIASHKVHNTSVYGMYLDSQHWVSIAPYTFCRHTMIRT